MDQPTHVIDPDGEVTIILRNANAPFAEWDEDMVSQTLVEASKDVQKHEEANEVSGHSVEEPITFFSKKERKKNKRSRIRPIAQPTSEPVEQSIECSVGEPVGESSGDPLEDISHEPVDETIREPGNEDQTESPIRILVSAKHLMVASPWFKKSLSRSFKEGVTFLRKGSVEITAESWDIEAFLILLRIMHCQFNQIPRKLSLDILAKVAVIADYYDCKEFVQFFSDMWIGALEEQIPTAYSRHLILWLWVAWFYRLPEKFKKITSIAMSQSNFWIDNLGLPIPDKIIGKRPVLLLSKFDHPLMRF